MGLDLLELTLETERVFGLRFSNAELTVCQTPRHVIDLVWSKLAAAGRPACASQHTFYRLREALVRNLRLSPDSIRPDTPLQTLFPSEGRWERWEDLRKTLNPIRWPHVAHRSSFQWVLVVGVLVVEGILCIWLRGILPAVGTTVLCIVLAVAGVLSLASALQTPPSCDEIGGCVRDLVPYLQPPPYMSRKEVAQRFKAICEEQLGLDLTQDQHWEDADFVRDWSADRRQPGRTSSPAPLAGTGAGQVAPAPHPPNPCPHSDWASHATGFIWRSNRSTMMHVLGPIPGPSAGRGRRGSDVPGSRARRPLRCQRTNMSARPAATSGRP